MQPHKMTICGKDCIISVGEKDNREFKYYSTNSNIEDLEFFDFDTNTIFKMKEWQATPIITSNLESEFRVQLIGMPMNELPYSLATLELAGIIATNHNHTAGAEQLLNLVSNLSWAEFTDELEGSHICADHAIIDGRKQDIFHHF